MEQLDRPFHRRFLSPGSDSDADTGSGGALVEEQPGHTAGDAVIPLQQLDCQPQKDWTDSDHRKRENTPHDRACCRLSVSCSLTLLSTPLQGGGAAGVNLTVEREGSPGGKYSTAETVLSAADGSYVFSDLAPGRYAITAAHPSWSFAGAGTAHATVTWGEDADAETITVSGFTVSGVVSSGGLWWTQARGPQPLVRALPPPSCGGPREVRWPCSSDSHTAAAADRRARLPLHAGPVQSRLGVHPSADGRGS